MSGSTPAERAPAIQASSSAVCVGLVSASHGTARRANWKPAARKRGSLNMSGFWSAMPIVSACAGAATERAASSTASGAAKRIGMSVGDLFTRWSLMVDQDGVLVRVRGRTAAQQHERLLAGVDEGVDLARRDHDAIAGGDIALRVAERHAPAPGGEEVQLLGGAVVVGDRAPADGDRRLGEGLVARRRPRGADDLADGRAV